MLFDTHCHLDFEQFDKDRDKVIKRALEKDVQMINASIDMKTAASTLKLAEKKGIYATLGFYPMNSESPDEVEAFIREKKKSIVGIGEVGLDYYWEKDERKRAKQKELFSRFINLANELKLPLVVHSRDAEQDCIDALRSANVPVVMHCFSGTIEQAKDCVDRNYPISISSNITYSKSRQELAKAIELESIVLETDSPYLAPTPKTRNEPVNVVRGAMKIAEIKGIEFDNVSGVTTKNANKVFF